jgi:hypothetical protein
MTKDEFVRRLDDSERAIRRGVAPLGIVYSLRVSFGFAAAALAAMSVRLLLLSTHSGPLLIALALCAAACAATFPAERASKQKFIRLSLKCPSCGGTLAFLGVDRAAAKTLETGLCFRCGARLFDADAGAPRVAGQ